MKYFPFEELQYKGQLLEVFLFVAFVYILIFSVAWVYNRFS